VDTYQDPGGQKRLTKVEFFLEISCIQLTMLDPDPYQMNTDPKYWVWCAYPDPTHPGADPAAENGSDIFRKLTFSCQFSLGVPPYLSAGRK
jgi:hypothetical protein